MEIEELVKTIEKGEQLLLQLGAEVERDEALRITREKLAQLAAVSIDVDI